MLHTFPAFSFDCSACGKCCNSPPAMSLPELFPHRDRFIGCLSISRVPRRRVGESLRAGLHAGALDEEDVTAFESIATTLLHRTASATFSIVAQGYDYPSLARCPALLDDGRCAIHHDGKPVTCEAVPLDPLVPDRLQGAVLAARSQSAVYLGADCIREGERQGGTLFVAQERVVDHGAADALARRRNSLLQEREIWGNAVFESLRRELFESSAALARIPDGGFLTLSIVPALLAVAGASEACRDLCVDYIDSQLALIDRSIAQAMVRKRLDDRPATQELRGFASAYQRAKVVLGAPLSPQHAARETHMDARVESYLRGAELQLRVQ